MKFKVIAQTELHGNIRRFNSMYNSDKIRFYIVSDGLNEVDACDWYIIDTKIEQGHNFIIEVVFYIESETSDFTYFCKVDDNKHINVINDEIIEINVIG